MNVSLTWLTIILVSVPVHADTVWTSRDGHYTVTFESELEPIVINRMHRWLLEITDPRGNAVDGAKVSVDGGMPAHDHGLPTRPRVTGGKDEGRYVLEGLRFHMGGLWEIELTIEADGLRDVAVIRLVL